MCIFVGVERDRFLVVICSLEGLGKIYDSQDFVLPTLSNGRDSITIPQRAQCGGVGN